MGLFSFLTGKSPEEIELVGDKFFKAEEFGAAKIEYEKAVARAENKFPEKENLISRLHDKIKNTRERLALAHKQNSEHLIDGNIYDEAEDLLNLALELTENDNLKNEIQATLQKLHQAAGSDQAVDPDLFYSGDQPSTEVAETADEDEYFTILCHSLPEETQEIYMGYDRNFRQGYIALNNGDFESAVEKFTRSMEDSESANTLIPLELSTALVNMEDYGKAREIMEAYIQSNEDEIRAYQILCDVYWVMQDYAAALDLLDQCPGDIKDSFPIRMLMGETFFQMERYPEARDLFAGCEEQFGENEIITRALAKTHESMGNLDTARDIYGKILNSCTKCGARTDPFIMNRYADLCYASGERSSRLVEIYLTLLQQDADNTEVYGQRIYEVYNDLGNKAEAARYQQFVK